MDKMQHNEIINYFCQELPDRYNLLAHRANWLLRLEGRKFDVLVFTYKEGRAQKVWPMAFCLN